MTTQGERTLHVVDNIEDVEGLRPIWTRMLEQEPNAAVTADPDRFLTVVRAGNGDIRPYVMLFERAGHAEAMVVARAEVSRLACRLGYLTIFNPSLRCLSIVHGGVLGRLPRRGCEDILQSITEALNQGVADVAFFNHLAVDSDLYRLIKTSTSRGRFVNVEQHWRTTIPGSIDELHSRFSKKHRKSWNRLARKLGEAAKGETRVRSFRSESDVNDFLAAAAKISASTYQDKVNAGYKDTSLRRALLTQAARSGWWRGYILYAGDVACAFETGFLYRGCYFLEAIGYDSTWSAFSPGTLLFVMGIEQLCEDPTARLFDFGFGSAPYKERFGTDNWLEASPYIFARRFYPAFVRTVHACVGCVHAGLQRVGAKAGVATAVKRRWRRRLQRRAHKDTESAKSG